MYIDCIEIVSPTELRRRVLVAAHIESLSPVIATIRTDELGTTEEDCVVVATTSGDVFTLNHELEQILDLMQQVIKTGEPLQA